MQEEAKLLEKYYNDYYGQVDVAQSQKFDNDNWKINNVSKNHLHHRSVDSILKPRINGYHKDSVENIEEEKGKYLISKIIIFAKFLLYSLFTSFRTRSKWSSTQRKGENKPDVYWGHSREDS